jgi:pimeloyl-ACP methyl ester carboxylesterase
MNIQCSQLDDLLFDGSPLAMQTAARHAEQCAECAERLASWNDISAVAQTMHTTWENDLLWPRIERAIRNERRGATKYLRQYAAAAVLALTLGGTLYYGVRQEAHNAAFDKDIIRVAAMDEVEQAERAHLASIEKLERVAVAKLDDAQTPLMIAYKEKLMLIDDAIAECETNIDRNRQNAHLRKQLLAMYSEKQQTLQDVLREDSNVSNP